MREYVATFEVATPADASARADARRACREMVIERFGGQIDDARIGYECHRSEGDNCLFMVATYRA